MRWKQVRVGTKVVSSALITACTVAVFSGSTRGDIVTPNPNYSVNFDNGESDVADFNSYPQGATAATNTWTVNGGQWQHQFAGNGGGGSYVGELVQTSGVVGTSFKMSTDFTLASRSISGNNYLFGLAVLSNGNFSAFDGNAHWDLAQIRLSGNGSGDQFSIAQNDGQWGTDLPGTSTQVLNFTNADSTLGISIGVKYHLSVTGTYDESGDLVLSTTLTDTTNALNTLTLTSDPIVGPLTDAEFGYSDIGFYGDGATINYDNFSLSVPEPASLSLLGVGAVGLLYRRRRRV